MTENFEKHAALMIEHLADLGYIKVVRCYECKEYSPYPIDGTEGYCRIHKHNEGFLNHCSHGKKKEKKKMKKNEIRVYILTIPNQELFDYWMTEDHGEVLQKIQMVGINHDPSSDCTHMLFRNTEDRNNAYNLIHEEYPESLCAYNVRVAYIDRKYLKEA